MRKTPVKWDPDAGMHTASEADVKAIVIRYDSALCSLVLDIGGIDPCVAATWISYAADHVEKMIEDLFGGGLLLEGDL